MDTEDVLRRQFTHTNNYLTQRNFFYDLLTIITTRLDYNVAILLGLDPIKGGAHGSFRYVHGKGAVDRQNWEQNIATTTKEPLADHLAEGTGKEIFDEVDKRLDGFYAGVGSSPRLVEMVRGTIKCPDPSLPVYCTLLPDDLILQKITGQPAAPGVNLGQEALAVVWSIPIETQPSGDTYTGGYQPEGVMIVSNLYTSMPAVDNLHPLRRLMKHAGEVLAHIHDPNRTDDANIAELSLLFDPNQETA